jgi:peptidoglycan/LPS O-acetylase OafA/YrhL
MQRSANLDILRSFAVSVVLIDHLVRTLVARESFHSTAIVTFSRQIGHVGVLAFFVHTSLVLMYSLERITHTGDRVSLRFYLRRFFRIYPLSIFCVTSVLTFHVPICTWWSADMVTPRVIVANYLLVQNLVTKVSVLSPLWSLPYEVQMYLVLPALYYLSLRKQSIIYLSGLILFFSGLGLLISWKTGHLNMAAYIPCFLCGVLCYALRNRIREVFPSVLWPLFVFLLISSYCLVNHDDAPNYWIGWIFCIVLGLAINLFGDSNNKYLNAVAEKVALYSYGMYLFHLPILYLVFVVLGIHHKLFGTFLFVVLTMAVSATTYHFIESPFIEIGRRLSSRPVFAHTAGVSQPACLQGELHTRVSK